MNGHEDEVVGWVVGWLLTNVDAPQPALQVAEASAPQQGPGAPPPEAAP